MAGKPTQKHLKGMEPKLTPAQKLAKLVVAAEAEHKSAKTKTDEKRQELLDFMAEKKIEIVKVSGDDGYIHIYTIEEKQNVKHTKELEPEPLLD